MSSEGTHPDFAESDSRVDVSFQQMFEEMHENPALGSCVGWMPSSCGNLVVAHGLLDAPLSIQYEAIYLELASYTGLSDLKGYSTEKKAVKSDAEGPDVDGFGYRLRRWAGGILEIDRVVYDLGGHEHGRAGFYGEVGVVEQEGVARILGGGSAGSQICEALRIGEMRGSKVSNFHMCAVFGPEEIGGLNVAMYDALAVHCITIRADMQTVQGGRTVVQALDSVAHDAPGLYERGDGVAVAVVPFDFTTSAIFHDWRTM